MSNENTPGRLNIYEFNEFSVLVDYAHNAHGVRALGKFIQSFDVETKTGVITGVGDRRDEDIIALAEEAARIFDEIIIRHDEDLRGRTPEELDKLLTEGVKRVDSNLPISYYWGELEAAEKAIINAKPKSLIVVLTDNIKAVSERILHFRKIDQDQVITLQKAV
jgi:cyanophycin synthetase